MEESDNMLIATIRQSLTIPKHILTLQDIKIQEVISLSLAVLQYLSVDTTQIKNMGKTQRFRSMTKLNQFLAQHIQSQFQLNDLMNPSVPFVRKMLLFLIAKIASNQPSFSGSGQNIAKKQNNQNRKKKQCFQKWINQEWIHPQLINPPNKSMPHRLGIILSKQSYKRNIIKELSNVHLKQSCLGILSNSIGNQKVLEKENQAKEGLYHKDSEDITRFLYKIGERNQDQWIKSKFQQDTKRNKKIRQNLFRVDEEVFNQNNKINQPTIFQRQIEEIADDKKNREKNKIEIEQSEISTEQNIMENAVQKIKRQTETKKKELQKLIYQIMNELKNRKQNLQNLSNKKQNLEQQLAKDEQKISSLKEKNNQLKKEVEKRQVLLNCVDNQTDIAQQVKKLQEEVKNLQKQAKNQIQQNESEIKNIQAQGKYKLQILNDLKLKLNRIQTDYRRVCEQIAQKEELKGKVKIAKSGISRNYYSKKISQVESRWRQTQKESKKNQQTLLQLREVIRKNITYANRVQTEIQNLFNMDKNKNQAQAKEIRQIFNKCKATFTKTMTAVEKMNEYKKQTQQYETKVHILSGKNYTTNIEKLKLALDDLKKEINQIKSKVK